MGSASNTPARGNSSWSPKRGAASSSKPWRANRRSPTRSSGSRSMVNAGTGTWPTGADTVWTGDREADVAVTTVGSVETEVASNCNTRSEEHTSELQSPCNLVCRLLLEKKKKEKSTHYPSHPRDAHTRAAMS